MRPAVLGVAALLLAAASSHGCIAGAVSEADAIVDRLSSETAKGQSAFRYEPTHKQDYTVIVMPGPAVDGPALAALAVNAEAISSLVASAPPTFGSALVWDDWRGTSVAWFLSNAADAEKLLVVKKRGGEPLTVKLRLGGPRPTILAVE